MAKGILIDGAKLAALLGEKTTLPQDEIGRRIGMKRSGVFRLTRKGVRGMHGVLACKSE